jgi:hypothetical protein
VFNIEPGRRTEVIGLIDVRFKPAELGGLVSSFGVFEEPRDPDAPDEPELQDWELPEHVS